MSKKIVTQETEEQLEELDLEPFTITLNITTTPKPSACLCFVGVPAITLNGTLANAVRERLGETVSLQADPDTGNIALLEGDERKLMLDRKDSDIRKISVSRIADELTEVFGKCRSVYFDPEFYSNAVLLKPNGRKKL